ncbi:GNAT family N-acetyltransferase [Bordetella genomosp. 13]|uniref:GNAT family N-acetyltransferase n=1 Tax=Bordetella genomosp. 13 TaxID=463040 RepID=UPI0011A9B2D3|nr:GNAT family N-acetyltransferase [Bordetella genomosp. 13]
MSNSSPAARMVVDAWERLRDDASVVRHAVFVVEQSVPVEIEMDDQDAVSVHAVAYDAEGRPVATGRLLPDGHIGRMAVMARTRGAGVGGQVLRALIERARAQGHAEVALNAQTHARAFYEGHGFVAEGDEFVEAGIPHVSMRLALD